MVRHQKQTGRCAPGDRRACLSGPNWRQGYENKPSPAAPDRVHPGSTAARGALIRSESYPFWKCDRAGRDLLDGFEHVLEGPIGVRRQPSLPRRLKDEEQERASGDLIGVSELDILEIVALALVRIDQANPSAPADRLGKREGHDIVVGIEHQEQGRVGPDPPNAGLLRATV